MGKAKSLPLIKTGILAPVLDWLESSGANVERYLDRARIPGDLIVSGGWIAKKQGYSDKLNAMLELTKSGDIRNGQAIFHGTKAACSACHAAGYLGGRIGPGQRRWHRSLHRSQISSSSG